MKNSHSLNIHQIVVLQWLARCPAHSQCADECEWMGECRSLLLDPGEPTGTGLHVSSQATNELTLIYFLPHTKVMLDKPLILNF